MTQEQKFLDALKDIFVGAPVEGDSGFINLMKIKARYYEQAVFPQLLKDVDKATKPFEKSFREELFDKLFAFFNRYFSESGSIYFRHTPLHQNIYERVYTDDRDVMLFWKTHMLYYVKTDRLFQSMGVEVDAEKFWFDVSALEHKRANEKRELTYTFQSRKADGTLVFTVAYSEKGRKTKVDDLLRAIKETGVTLEEDTLLHAFRVFEKQSEVDYFINKNAQAFLKEQFDLWLYQYVFSGENAFTVIRLKQLQALKDVACHIIDFIAQFEDELVRVWNKPKFVLNSNYIITLDKIAALSPNLLARLLKHKGMGAQVDEWRTLGMLDDDFKLTDILRKDKLFDPIHSKYQFLPLDTRYFKDLELDILALFDDLDNALDGWLVHSENYQALNTLLPKYQERLDVVYIDPPFNTAASEIIYQNQYKHSSWLSLMDDRLRKAKDFMKDASIICTAIDDFEAPSLGQCLSNIFDEDLHLATVLVRSNPHGRAMAAGFSQNHEFAFFYGKTKKATVGRLPRGEKEKARYPEKDGISNFAWMNFRATGANSRRYDRPKLFYPIFIEKKGDIRISTMRWSKGQWEPEEPQLPDDAIVLPIDVDGSERVWNLGWERAKEEAKAVLQSKLIDGKWQIFRKYRPNEDGMLPATWWDNAKYSATESGTKIIKDLFGERELFSYPKSVFLVEDCLRAANCAPATLALDFFAGSGTTAHAVMNLNRADKGNRKYILFEMGEHFNTVILPRIKKVAFSDKWKDGKANGGQGMSQFVKYYDLEQYEDTLRRARYESTNAPLFQMTDVYSSYVFLRDLKLLDAVKLDKTADRIEVQPKKLYEGIDLAETLSCVTGKWIKHITKDTVELEDGTIASLSDPDWSLIKPLIWW
jgi:adenine-specific DNA-methyltransferase